MACRVADSGVNLKVWMCLRHCTSLSSQGGVCRRVSCKVFWCWCSTLRKPVTIVLSRVITWTYFPRRVFRWFWWPPGATAAWSRDGYTSILSLFISLCLSCATWGLRVMLPFAACLCLSPFPNIFRDINANNSVCSLLPSRSVVQPAAGLEHCSAFLLACF